MTGKFTVNVDKNKKRLGVDHWRVEGKINGRRIRAYFPTKEKAQEDAYKRNLELENHGHQAADIPGPLRVVALACAAKLERLGEPTALLDQAVNEFLARYDLRSKSATVTQAWENYKTHCEGRVQADDLSPRSFESFSKFCSHFERDFGSNLVCDITTERIQAWIDSLKCEDGTPYANKSKEGYRLALSGFFSHCVRRKWLSEHPIKGDKIPGYRSKHKPPGFFTLEQASKLLEVADAEILPVVAIGLFCGLRPNEIQRLDWAQVHWHNNQIDVLAANAKTAKYRYVPIPANLVEWLAPYRTATGRVFGGSLSSMNRKLRAAGVAAGIAKWPADGLRHSFGSYFYAMSENAAKTAKRMGHKGTDMLFANYNNRRSDIEGKAYFEIRPVQAQDLLAAA